MVKKCFIQFLNKALLFFSLKEITIKIIINARTGGIKIKLTGEGEKT